MQQGADALAAKIGRTLDCKAQAVYQRAAWAVTTSDAIYTSPFDWYYQRISTAQLIGQASGQRADMRA